MRRLLQLHHKWLHAGPDGWLEGALCACLVPLAWLYGGVGLLRAASYRWGLLPSYRAAVPVVSVGNLAAGGTGKTPVVDYLLRYFAAEGKKVAVVSRGYGGRGGAGPRVVSSGFGPVLSPAVCGDEPYLLARRNPGALVIVAAKRARGVALAEKLGAQIILLDDGFQHLAVQRDLDIVLLDAGRPLGNGRVLPAGYLREFPGALQRGDFFLLTRHRPGADRPVLPLPGPVACCQHHLAEDAWSLQGERIALADLAGKKGIAFAGIANPQDFFAALAEKGLELEATLPLPDHARYNKADLEELRRSCRGADYLITTEKDGVKLAGDTFAVPCYQVPLSISLGEAAGLEKLLQSLTDPR
jgi:tetraacyldisaccharide 4'-kinase